MNAIPADPGPAFIIAEDEPLEYAWHVGQECFMVQGTASGVVVLQMDEDGAYRAIESPNVASGLAQELLRVATQPAWGPPEEAEMDFSNAGDSELLHELERRYANPPGQVRGTEDPARVGIRAAVDMALRIFENEISMY